MMVYNDVSDRTGHVYVMLTSSNTQYGGGVDLHNICEKRNCILPAYVTFFLIFVHFINFYYIVPLQHHQPTFIFYPGPQPFR